MDRARRQLPEWEGYDQQVDKLRKRVSSNTVKEGTITRSIEKEELVLVKEKKHVKDEL